jgi:xanthine dehydrogenase large subunit
MLVIEEVMAQAAQRLGLPADVVRERNLYRDGDTTHYGQPVAGAARLGAIWSGVKASSDFDVRRGEIAAFNAQHAHTKRGLAITPVKFGISFTATFFNQGAALVLIYRDGSVQVNHGGTEMGQGLFTKVQQIAAATLGVDADRVRVMPTRTDKVPNTSATAASAGTDLNGAAVLDACLQLKGRLAAVANGESLPFPEVCERAYRQRVPLFAEGFYRTPEIHWDTAT